MQEGLSLATGAEDLRLERKEDTEEQTSRNMHASRARQKSTLHEHASEREHRNATTMNTSSAAHSARIDSMHYHRRAHFAQNEAREHTDIHATVAARIARAREQHMSNHTAESARDGDLRAMLLRCTRLPASTPARRPQRHRSARGEKKDRSHRSSAAAWLTRGINRGCRQCSRGRGSTSTWTTAVKFETNGRK